ncbi:MAG: mechanosensitive ion channel [Candidatus Gracilibacteria bacterium]|nr:mechanosensitive ion channel [Candidatus Gracilibacteria bacterium]
MFDFDTKKFFDYISDFYDYIISFFDYDFEKIINFTLEYLNSVIILGIVLGFIITEIYLRKRLRKVKNDINKKYSADEMEEIDNLETLDQDLYIEYYKGKNILNLIRFVIVFSGVSFLILFRAPGIFNFLAIAVGAIIITFKEVILSFMGFFYISTHYKIGENLLLGDNNNIIRGEIVYINILNVGIIGKSENGEHNGQFYTVPNHKLVVENVKREELSVNKYRKEEFEIYFKNDMFRVNFDEFLSELRNFLDKELTRKNINNIGNYKTYIGYKYKLRFKYEKEYLIIRINLIEKYRNIIIIQSKLTSFVESLKKDYIKNEVELNKNIHEEEL